MTGFEGFFSRFIKGAVGGANSQENPVVGSVLRWMGTLQGNMLLRWSGVAASGQRCSLRPKDAQSGKFVPCVEPVLGVCMFCRHGVCLHHAQINLLAEIVCMKCMAEAATIMRERHPESAGPAPSVPQDDWATKRQAALKVLGLKDPATWDEIRAQHRALVAKWHPDKLGPSVGAKKRAQHEVKMKEFSQAFEWLKQHDTTKAA